jgi:hypothetical protein
VGAQIDDRAGEAVIAHRRHGDQELAIEIAFIRRMGSACHGPMLQQFRRQGKGNHELRQFVSISPLGLTKE